MIKILGSVLIIGASTWLGFAIAQDLILRTKQLQELQTAFRLLETEIMYTATPLPKALLKIGEKVNSPIADLFLKCEVILKNELGITADQAWNRAVEKIIPKTALTYDDKKILTSFGKNLGNSSREYQEKNLKFIQEQLKLAEKNSVTIKEDRVKIWRYFGVLGGGLIVILLY
ncbi:stage III sporulation protein SpoIIIAB [Selenihalanaerobacter shriftii]|uniref:Stage III sporulation protein AB n=1 Tax=Selenihalanaerobacter shriftii TaxID=142842 RepID=A0A1T4P358_9FIRM|nr:stage III sporulation protein SpoIIIAB [Selenihalanaerobacter shriftii]SJZ85852.1 stage III sporulation protein AB [Selenihalanaerobacter shriftii]